MMRSLVLVIALAGTALAQPAKQHEQAARAAFIAGDWDKAIAEYEAALVADPTRIALHIALGQTHAKKNDIQGAIDAYSKYPVDGPDYAEAKSAIDELRAKLAAATDAKAESIASQARIDGSTEGFESAYKVSPKPEYLFAIAELLEKRAEKRAAITAYRRYLAAAPQGPGAAKAQSTIATLESAIGFEAIVESKRGEAELAANEARAAASDARVNVDASKIAPARAAVTKASISADVAKRAATAARDASAKAGSSFADRQAAEAETFAATARTEADEASKLVEAAALRLHVDEPREVLVGERPQPGHGLRIGGLVVTSAGGAALITGVVFGMLAHGAASDVSDVPDKQWTTDLDRRIEDGQHDQTISRICFGVAGGLVIGGVALYYLGVRRDASVTVSAKGAAVGWAF